MYMLVLPFWHVHHVRHYDFAAKSVFKYFVVFLNKPQCMRFIYMPTMVLVQTEVVRYGLNAKTVHEWLKYTGVMAD